MVGETENERYLELLRHGVNGQASSGLLFP